MHLGNVKSSDILEVKKIILYFISIITIIVYVDYITFTSDDSEKEGGGGVMLRMFLMLRFGSTKIFLGS